MKFIITGFTPFGGLSYNPAESTAREASKKLSNQGFDVTYTPLNVSIPDVLEFYATTMPITSLFVLHIGCDASAYKMKIEYKGHNRANFSIPDSEGFQPFNKPIDDKYPLDHTLTNKIDVPALVNSMPTQFDLSNDAGNYICNYIYYTGLGYVGDRTVGCLFVHVPLYDQVEEETQIQNIVDLVNKISKLPEFQNK